MSAADAERGGDRRQRRLGGLAVYGLGADPYDQGACVLAAYSRARRAGPDPDSYPHAPSVPPEYPPVSIRGSRRCRSGEGLHQREENQAMQFMLVNRRSGRLATALAGYDRAIELTTNHAERRYLTRARRHAEDASR
jgi:hypothetical protein